ncbi:putative glycosyltransferase 7 [Salvia hispanica]|uniref:putative glycosyltransferase 7 n=1 Tax=Salvia hispanica TaxID=49212 RepID=UPI002009B874|nr:putative glycosyltransferase 7 [Salvia hispanica]
MGRHLQTLAAAVLFLLLSWLFFTVHFSMFPNPNSDIVCQLQEPTTPTFYDDPTDIYTLDTPMLQWDKKRSRWLHLHPAFSPPENRLLLVTGSQPSPCPDPEGDHLLLRFFKNKVDYCRIHAHDIFYNNAHLHPKVRSVWVKLAALRAAMVAHPQVEWLFWLDSDAVITDMDFVIPFERYEGYNMVVDGWPDLLVNRSWVAVNAGSFFIRNCGWSMEFLDVWAGMSPKSPSYEKWGGVLRSTFKDKMFPEADEQSSLIYLILEGPKRWREKIYLENRYALSGYWHGIVGRFDGMRAEYGAWGEGRRRHAEVVSEWYGAERGRAAKEGGWRRPFVTHFTGCQPCSGKHNAEYEGDSCSVGMKRALNFADDQVLRNYGFVHTGLGDASPVVALKRKVDH